MASDVNPEEEFSFSVHCDELVGYVRENATLYRDDILAQRATTVYNEHAPTANRAAIPLVPQESTQRALQVLRRFGLVPYQGQESLDLSQFLCTHVLNHGSGGTKNACLQITTADGDATITIPPHRLLLQELASSLHVNIFVFSSRSKAHRYHHSASSVTIAIFESVNSFEYTHEFLPLVAATTIMPVIQPGPTEDSDANPAKPAAEYRTGSRKRGADEQGSEFTAELYRSFVDRACTHVLKQEVCEHVAKIYKKGPDEGMSLDESVESTRGSFKKNQESRQRIPRSTLGIAANMINTAYNSAVTAAMISSKARTSFRPLDRWTMTIDASFDGIWESEAAKQRAETMQQTTSDEDTQEEESQHTPANDSEENAGNPKSKEELRTFTVPLHQILRSEVIKHYKHIVETAGTTQLDLHRVAEELSVIALKTVRVLSSGVLYQNSPTDVVFDMHSVLPSGFELRDKSISPPSVAPLPTSLESHLEQRLEGSVKADDLCQILSKEFLEFAYSRLLAKPRAGKEVGDNKHPLWANAVDLVRSSLPEAPTGVSRTVVEYFTQLATAIGNIWSGATYTKALEYLTRILLRIHLAPRRESMFRQCSKQKKETKHSRHWTRSHWKWRMAQLMDELADARERDRPNRIQAVLRLLLITNDQKPPSNAGTTIPNIDEQLIQWNANHRDTQEPDSNALTSPIQDLEALLSVFVHQDEEVDLEDMEEMLWPDDIDFDDFSPQENQDPLSTPVAKTTPTPPEDPPSKDSTRTQLKALQRVLITLLESPSIEGLVSPSYVRASAYKGTRFSDRECQTVASLVNALRPYVPKRRQGDDGRTKAPIEHPAARCPIVMIANSILKATGYPHFTREISPQVSPMSCQAMPLNAVGMYEVFCGRDTDGFDIKDARGSPLTSVANVTTPPENKRAVFESFLDMDKIDRMCSKHGLVFAERIVYVDRLTIRIVGKVQGTRQTSAYEKRRKAKTRTPGRDWKAELAQSDMTQAEIEEECGRTTEELDSMKSELSKLERMYRTSHEEKTDFSRRAATLKHNRYTPEESAAYHDLQRARLNERKIGVQLIQLKELYQALKKNQYYYNNLMRTRPSTDQTSTTTTASSISKTTTITWDQYIAEDSAEHMDIRQLIETENDNQRIACSGTDYGVKFMSESVPQRLSDIKEHINRFSVLQSLDENTDSSTSPRATPASRREATVGMKLPESFRITASYINDVSHTRKTIKEREKRLARQSNQTTRDALQAISKKDSVLGDAQSLADIERAQQRRREAGPALKEFENSKISHRERRTRELRKERAWSIAASRERTFLRDYTKELATMDHQISEGQDDEGGRTLLLMFTGCAGTGVGSRITGHTRLGGSTLRQQHRQYTPVVMTNEYRTSRVCLFCFKELRLATSCRIVKGKIKTVPVHGAVECWNPSCASFKAGYTTRPRDSHAAVAIAVAGMSNLLSPDRQTLPPFNPRHRPHMNTSTTLGKTFSSTTSMLMPGELAHESRV